MTQTSVQIWIVILLLGFGTFLIRFSFLGIIGNRPMPEWVLRHLRYTPVAVMPALIAPLVLWPAATGGATDLPRLLAAGVTVLSGVVTRNMLASVFAGAGTLYLSQYLLG